LGMQGGVVMEGRDIGTAVFPDAEVTIFLDADPEVRGVRRFRQVAPDQHEPAPLTEAGVLAEMRARDQRDRNRAQSPLKPAPDAIILDSTSMSLDEVLARSEEIVRDHLRGGDGDVDRVRT
jgi:cytidylate kinase